MKDELTAIFERFDGDITSAAVYLYLASLLNADERKLISLSELSQRTGLGRKRLRSILSRLHEMQLFQISLRPKRGYEISRVESKEPTVESKEPTVESKEPTEACVESKEPTVGSKEPSLTNIDTPVTTEGTEVDNPFPKEKVEALNLRLGSKTKAIVKTKTKVKTKTRNPAVLDLTPETPAKPKRKTTPKKPKEKSLGSLIWEAYEAAFSAKYGISPPRNAKTNAQCTQIGARLGQEAIEVIKSYVSHPDSFYVKKRHPLGLALADAERLHTDWKLGSNVSNYDASQTERYAATNDFFAKLKQEANEEEAKGQAKEWYE